MIKFEHTEVVGWEHAIRGMRNPMNSWEKSDSFNSTAAWDSYRFGDGRSGNRSKRPRSYDATAERRDRPSKIHADDYRVCGYSGSTLLVEGIRYIQSGHSCKLLLDNA